MSIIMASISGIVAAVSLLFISKSGWDDISSFVKMIFIIFTCSAIFYGAFPSIFKHKENIEQNKKLYIAYTNLENQILSYVSTGKNTDQISVTVSDFIIIVNKQLDELNSIPIELDPSAIPDPGKILKEMSNINQ